MERDTPGLGIGKKEEKLGMRSSDTVQVLLDNVRVPGDQLLGRQTELIARAAGMREAQRVPMLAEHARLMALIKSDPDIDALRSQVRKLVEAQLVGQH